MAEAFDKPLQKISKALKSPAKILLFMSIVLALVGAHFDMTATIYATIYIFLAVFAFFAGDYIFSPEDLRPLKGTFKSASKKAQQHIVLRKLYEDAKVNLKKNLENIIDGYFEFQITDVPNISEYAIQIVDRKCILLYPLTSEDILNTDKDGAKNYAEHMRIATERIANSSFNSSDSDKGVIRIFILKDFSSISSNLWQFINKNYLDKINVRFITLDFYRQRKAYHRNVQYDDFGYYETLNGAKWYMAISTKGYDSNTTLVINTINDEVSDYSDFAEDLVKNSISFQSFISSITTPINGDRWQNYFSLNSKNEFVLEPPHGLSNEDADEIVKSIEILETTSSTTSKKPSVLVLGRTPKILKRLSDSYNRGCVSMIVSVDNFRSTNPPINNILYKSANWIDMDLNVLSMESPFDAVLFDESINNLNEVQFFLFLGNLSRILKPGGMLIGRVMGKFEKEKFNEYNDYTDYKAYRKLQEFGGITHEDVSPLIICLLHSRDLAYDDSRNIISCSKWNHSVEQLSKKFGATPDEQRKWKVPFDFDLLSPDLTFLSNSATQFGFELFALPEVRGAYTELYSDISSFYRIVKFKLNL
jgi:hypothetical protein